MTYRFSIGQAKRAMLIWLKINMLYMGSIISDPEVSLENVLNPADIKSIREENRRRNEGED